MHRLRTTFTRSRTPTGAEMKTQNSLEVPKQVRSASFDEMQLEAQRAAQQLLKQQQTSSEEQSSAEGFLQVPQPHSQRSRSFDSAAAGSDDSGGFLDVPRRFQRRRSSSTKTPPPCLHCQYLEEYERQVSAEQRFFIDEHELKSLSYSSDSSLYSDDEDDEDDDDDDDEDGDDEDENNHHNVENEHDEINNNENYEQQQQPFGNSLLPPALPSPCNITFILSPTNGDYLPFPGCATNDEQAKQRQERKDQQILTLSSSPPCVSPVFPSSPTIELPLTFEDTPPPVRNRRRSISRQEAIFVEPIGNSLENVCGEENNLPSSADTEIDGAVQRKSHHHPSETQRTSTEESDDVLLSAANEQQPQNDLCVRDIYLAVPDLKRDRAASVDSCFSKLSSGGKTEELCEDGCLLSVPNINATRSRSVDIVLPTDEQARYKALALTGAAASMYGNGKSGQSAPRPIRIIPDWTENAINGDHLWAPTSASGDFCCIPDECRKSGQRMKCSACQLIAHINCIPIVNEKTPLACKPTFRDVGIRQYREQTTIHHHWVHRRAEKSKCKACGKAMPGKLFGSKEIVALSCAWCKAAYHNKESCFNPERIGEECSLGPHNDIIVPPSWIVKLPNKGNFKSSLRTQKTKPSGKKKPKDKEQKAFIIKPIPSANVTPVIVFINPKSGGNQGVKLLQKFQWLLNPRQVFDLTQGGPKMGLELFRKAPQLRVLACGGDGTVGWVLSVLDQINIQPAPAVGVLPLGTGNDLARALGWGGGYTDEPIAKILTNIGKSDTVLLDRWSLKVEPNPSAEPTNEGKDNLPLNVVNNYFSFGVDAHIALEFHEAREAHPEKFNSRLRNKMFYGQAGGKDLLQRKWKALADFVTLECDGQDYTPKLKEHRVHAIVFLNIPSYGGGTHPWNKSSGQSEPATDDGLIEVVGLTTYQLPLLQAGGHGTCICQCKTAKIVTTKTIPMQVDGEAAKLKPSIIELSLLNKAVMLAKKKPGRTNVQMAGLEPLNLSIHRITMPAYEQHHYDKELLKQSAINLGNIEIEPVSDLEQVRNVINKYCDESSNYPKLSPEWCFVDSCTAERFFRIDRAQEHLHYITDIASDIIYVLDQECATMPQTPDNDKSFAAFQQKQEKNHANNSVRKGPTRQKSEAGQIKIKSFQERLFSLSEDAFGFSNLLEKTSDAVILAAKTGDIAMLRALHEQGYSLLSIDSNGQTALHYASKFNHKDIVKYIISCAASSIINMVDNIKGQTALHVAAENKRRDISVMLVAAGASLSIRDHSGYTPMMLAFNADAHDLAAYLESKKIE